MKFLGDKSPAEFFDKYWEKNFLAIPNAVTIPHNAINEDDIFEMLSDEYFETRLITEDHKGQVKLEHGPLDIKNKQQLPPIWTMMVHNLNLYNEFAHKMATTVEFIPKWLFDDVMLSFSSKDSKINAHIDKYNVFILQVSGKRKWLIEHRPNKKWRDDCELRILEEFKADEEIILGPGDMIYIPPQVAHEGYSLEESLSLSIGFKSLEDKDMIESFFVYLMENLDGEEFFKTMFKNSAQENTYLLEDEHISQIKNHLLNNLSENKKFASWLNQYLSQPRVNAQKLDESMNKKDFINAVKEIGFSLDEHLRMNAYKLESTYYVAINTQEYKLSEKQYEIFKELIDSKHLEHNFSAILGIEDLLFSLYQNGLVNI